MKIAVISDTHGYPRPELISGISGVDHIIHAGDFDDKITLDELKKIAPITYVKGNCDIYWAYGLPETNTFECEGVKIFIIHDKGRINRDISEYDIIIHGHIHRYSEEKINGQTWFNPGTCGRPRFDPCPTYAILTIENGEYSFERRNINI